MIPKQIIEEALKLKPEERFTILESIIQSLDNPDKSLDDIWVGEAEKRLIAYRNGDLKGVPMEEMFPEK